MTIFYFTGTGNSLAVAKYIGGNLVSIPQVIDSGNLHFADDAVGFVFPIYWWNPPVMVRRFIDKATFESDYFFAIGTYGNILGGAMVSLQNRAERNGVSFSYMNQVKMLDNYIPVFDMNKQMKKLAKKNITEELAGIASDISGRKHLKAEANIGRRAMTGAFNRVFKPEKSARDYIVDEKCTKCGICSRVCPGGNVVVDERGVCFGHTCEGCLSCLHLCPQSALHLSGEKSDKRWRNPEVSLQEIIDSNNRN